MGNKVKEERKNKIITAAFKVFAKKGFNDATISEISKAAGISDVTLYEYFKNKEDLLFAIPEQVTLEAVKEVERVLSYVKGAENKIRAIVYSYMDLYERNPDYSSLVLLELRSNRNFHKSKAYAMVRRPARMLIDAINEGIETGEFKKDIEPFLIRSMFLGTLEHLFTRWHLVGKPENPSRYLDPIIEVILNGIRMKDPVKGFVIPLHLPDEIISAWKIDKEGAGGI